MIKYESWRRCQVGGIPIAHGWIESRSNPNTLRSERMLSVLRCVMCSTFSSFVSFCNTRMKTVLILQKSSKNTLINRTHSTKVADKKLKE